LDEVFVTIHGSRDQDGNILDILVQRRREKPPPRSSFVSCSKAVGTSIE
jgi:hypothetical protein